MSQGDKMVMCYSGEIPCYRVCFCTRRNGLQDTCPLTGCGGKPPCLTTPLPSCEPSGFSQPRSYKDIEFILCPAKTNGSRRSVSKRHPSSAPVTKDVSYASYCDPRSVQTAHTY
uniref:Sensory neuron membrane protein 1 n=1 Tax=Lygus hesperus TaxID=30085 RepID=A0A0A9WVK3_LYGHE